MPSVAKKHLNYKDSQDLVQAYKEGTAGKLNRKPDANLAPLTEKLASSNWSYQIDVFLNGKSEVPTRFALLVCRAPYVPDKAGRGEIVAVDIIRDDMSVEATWVYSLFARCLDCGIKKRILIAIPKLEEHAKKLAEAYGIVTIEAPDLILAAQALQSGLQRMAMENQEAKIGKGKMRSAKSSKRTTVDIMADILKVAQVPSSKTEMMACANLSFDQCQKYLPKLEKVGLIKRSLEDGIHTRFQTTEKGYEYLSDLFSGYGDIVDGEKSVWHSRRSRN